MTGILVTGMHHSGTSVVTGLLAAAGWHPGDVLVPDDPVTGKRYFEDADLVELHRAWYLIGRPDAEFAPGWGIAAGQGPHLDRIPDAVESAHEFVRWRNRSRVSWVAKDPRASLALPIWAQVPTLKFLLIYRSPWDVVRSVMQLGAPFCDSPDWIRSAWLTYNQAVLACANEHSERCLVVSSEAVLEDPATFVSALEDWTGEDADLAQVHGVIDDQRFVVRPDGSAISKLYRTLYPQHWDVLEQLDDAAGIPRRRMPQATQLSLVKGEGAREAAVQVIIPCRNDGQFLAEAIASVEETACHSPRAVELTLVDDGSDDESTLDIVTKLAAAGYDIVRQPPLGLPAARNAAIARGTAPAVLPLDADNNLCAPLMEGVSYILAGDADVVYGAWKRHGAHHSVCEPSSTVTWESFMPGNTIDACAVVRRTALLRVGGYDETLPALEDWDLWMRLLESGARFHRVNGITFEYLVRGDSMLSRFAKDHETFQLVHRRLLDRFGNIAAAKGISVDPWLAAAGISTEPLAEEPDSGTASRRPLWRRLIQAIR